MSYCEECASYACDCADKNEILLLKQEIQKLQSSIDEMSFELHGVPSRYDTWKSAAKTERVLRVKADARFAKHYASTIKLVETMKSLVCEADECAAKNDCEVCKVLQGHLRELFGLLNS